MEIDRATRRWTRLAVGVLTLTATIGCSSEDSTSSESPTDGGTEASTTTTEPKAADKSTTTTADPDEQAGDTGGAGTVRVVNHLKATLPALSDEEATCVAEVVITSLGDLAEVITGANPEDPLRPGEISQLTQSLAEDGEAASVEQNAAAVSECVADPVSFSAGASPPTGELAECANATLAGTPEYATYTGEFRFLGDYFDRTQGVIVMTGGGIEVTEPTQQLLVGACAG